MVNRILLLVILLKLIGVSKGQIPLKNDSISVLSWNIHMLPGTIYHATKKTHRAKLIAAEFIKRDYDILVIQEAFHFRARKILKRKLKDKYSFISKPLNFRFFSLKTNGGVWVLSKIDLQEIASVKFDVATGSSRWARKGAVLFQGKWREKTFQLIGTHTNGGGVNDRQFKMIYDELLLPYEIKGVPQIICGDLNCSFNNEKKYKSMLSILNCIDTPLDGDFNYSNHEKTSIIDYILVRNNNSSFEQFQKKILLIGNDWEIGERRYPETVGLSDHMPLQLIFSIK